MVKNNKLKNVWQLIGKKPYAVLASVLLVILTALLNVTEVIVLQRFIDGFSYFHWNQAFLFAVILAGIYGFHYVQGPLSGYLKEKIGLQLRSVLEDVVVEKAARISVEALEDKENQALLARLQDKPEKRFSNGIFSVIRILGGVLGMAGIFALVFENVVYFLPPILLLLGLLVIAFRLIGKNKVTLYRARKEIGRRSEYLADILFDRRLAQEKKLFGYTSYIQKLYEEENINSNRKLLKSIFFSNLILWFYDNITYLFSASAYLLFLIPLHAGEMDIGLYIAIIPALAKLGNFFVSVGSNYLPSYQEYRACYKDMGKLLALPEQYYVQEGTDYTLQPFHVIKGEGIVFRYPGQEKPVLDGLDFTFHVGKNYALVGENGCGKTTLIKLLMGFYQPEKGRITIDGEDIQKMEFGKLQRFFSAVFQDFNRYDYTIKENICMSALGTDSGMERAAEEAGLTEWIVSCPEGYDTKLGSLEEGSVGLSGGQWQRLSIARMLYRKAGICVWDEPTASMDPLAESRLYTNFFRKKSGDCANIFVTHRLGAAVGAGEICVMEKGRFIERGNHGQLMQKEDGLYRRMFEAQKGMYQ